MKTTTDYSGLEGEAKEAKAIADVRSHFGDRFERIVTVVRQFGSDWRETFVAALSMVGIEGYPAGVFVDWVLKGKL